MIYLQQLRSRFQDLCELLNSREEELVEKTRELANNKRKLEKDLERLNSQVLRSNLADIISRAEDIKGIKVISLEIPGTAIDQLKEIGDQIREQSTQTVALLGSKTEGKINFVCVVTDDLIKNKKLHAGDLVRQVAQVAGGSGGGKPHMATAGARDETKFALAMQKIKEIV